MGYKNRIQRSNTSTACIPELQLAFTSLITHLKEQRINYILHTELHVADWKTQKQVYVLILGTLSFRQKPKCDDGARKVWVTRRASLTDERTSLLMTKGKKYTAHWQKQKAPRTSPSAGCLFGKCNNMWNIFLTEQKTKKEKRLQRCSLWEQPRSIIMVNSRPASAQTRPENKNECFFSPAWWNSLWVFWWNKGKRSPQIHHGHGAISDGDMSGVLKKEKHISVTCSNS